MAKLIRKFTGRQIARILSEKVLPTALLKAGAPVLERTRRLALNVSSTLSATIRMTASRPRPFSRSVRISTGNREELGIDHFIFWPALFEFGGVNISPQPYMRPGLIESRTNVERILAREVGNELERAL